MKSKLFIVLIFILNTSCKAQKINELDLINKKHEVIEAFLNQNFKKRDSLYFEKNIYQKKYSEKFSAKYNSMIDIYKKSDSLCNNNRDIDVQRMNCLKAFKLEKYVSLFSQKKLEYFKNTYNRDKENFTIQINKVTPKILSHSKEKSLNFKEVPSLKIHGIYFSKKNDYALISFSIFPLSLREGIKYGILKNEKDVWWRYIGSINLNSRKISH